MELVIITDEQKMRELGAQIGAALKGGEIFELIGDVGAGKTTFLKGLAAGLKIDDDVQSPSFTISRIYAARDNLILAHYDFYRLNDAGIMKMEIAENLAEPENITAIEWGESVNSVLPADRIVVKINYLPETGREISLQIPAKNHYLSDIME